MSAACSRAFRLYATQCRCPSTLGSDGWSHPRVLHPRNFEPGRDHHQTTPSSNPLIDRCSRNYVVTGYRFFFNGYSSITMYVSERIEGINYPSLVSNILFDGMYAIPSSIEFQFLSNLFPLLAIVEILVFYSFEYLSVPASVSKSRVAGSYSRHFALRNWKRWKLQGKLKSTGRGIDGERGNAFYGRRKRRGKVYTSEMELIDTTLPPRLE